jgi:hypothetical protein
MSGYPELKEVFEKIHNIETLINERDRLPYKITESDIKLITEQSPNYPIDNIDYESIEFE